MTGPEPDRAPARAPTGPEGPRAAVEGGNTGAETGGSAPPRIGWLPDEGAFVLPIGTEGVRLGPDLLGDRARGSLSADRLPALLGLAITEASYNLESRNRTVTIRATTAIPLMEEARLALHIARDGTVGTVSARSRLALDWLDRPRVQIAWTPTGGLVGEIEVDASALIPPGFSNKASAEGDVAVGIDNGAMTGRVDATVTVPDLVVARFDGGFGGEAPQITVGLDAAIPWLGPVRGEGRMDATGALSGHLEADAASMSNPVPGLDFTAGTLRVEMGADGALSGGATDLAFDYQGVASATASFTLVQGRGLQGNAALTASIPGLSTADGTLAAREGKLSGSISIGKASFPRGLPLERGTITVRVGETGGLSFDGSVRISLGPAAQGELRASRDEAGNFTIGATVEAEIPGLQRATITLSYNGTDITGEGEVATDPGVLSGIEGRVLVAYAEGRWSGETTLGYEADSGKLSGEITVRVAQQEDGSLTVGGEGRLTARIAPRLEGTLTATILEEGGIDVSGEIVVTEPLELFPENRFEREILNVTQNIPLWALLVAVLRIRAGVRAGIGPGVFRDITVTGSYTIGQEGEPEFEISGEMFIPAFVEGYVGFGAGLGASVVLGSLTGGIEAMGTAGLYGAISVVPVLTYQDGDYGIEGTATMAAGARLKLSLNAWAEVEALWVTVWEQVWELASVSMPVGPDLGLEAKMAYTFGDPSPPTLEFNTSDVDTDALIESAMPKDGPPSAGVRDAVRNEAQWQGEQRRAGRDADAVPDELSQEAAQDPNVPRPPGGRAPDGAGAPPRGADGTRTPSGPPDGAVPTDSEGRPIDPAAQDRAAAEAAAPDPTASGTVTDDAAADSTVPRHPRVHVGMLDEPPVPMPRTKAQQEADVAAAARLVGMLAGSGETTDQLDNYFPRVKQRFRLGSIGYVRRGTRLQIQVKVNTEEEVAITEEYQRLTEIGGADLGPGTTRVTYGSVNRSYSDGARSVSQQGMGIEMTADPLTPFHGRGSGPRSSALGNVFGLLETQGETGHHGYIKGHLLNDNLGGPGESRNLFPITQTANTRHESEIESVAKTLVNDRHYWVRYTVKMEETAAEPYMREDAAGNQHPRLAIDARIVAELAVKRTDGSETETARVTIPSIFPRDQRGDRAFEGMTRAEVEALSTNATDPRRARVATELDTRRDLPGQIDAAQAAAGHVIERSLTGLETAPARITADLLAPAGQAGVVRERADEQIDQSAVLLSAARRDSAVPVTAAVVRVLGALRGLDAGARALGGADGTSTLEQMLNRTAIGTSATATLFALARGGARLREGDDARTVALPESSQRDVLRQIISAGPDAIAGVLATFAAQRAAVARVRGLDLARLGTIARGQGGDSGIEAPFAAHNPDLNAFARFFALQVEGVYASWQKKADFLALLSDLGKAGDPFLVKVSNQIRSARPTGDADADADGS